MVLTGKTTKTTDSFRCIPRPKCEPLSSASRLALRADHTTSCLVVTIAGLAGAAAGPQQALTPSSPRWPQVAFDPATKRRLSVGMNARNAALFGAHREELLARFAGFDADQQIPELDRLMILLHEFQARRRPAPPRPAPRRQGKGASA